MDNLVGEKRWMILDALYVVRWACEWFEEREIMEQKGRKNRVRGGHGVGGVVHSSKGAAVLHASEAIGVDQHR